VGAEAQKLWGSQALTVASAVMTLLVLFLSEIIPKTLGALYWRQLAPWMAWLLPPLIWALFPLVWISKFTARVFSAGKRKGMAVLPEEIAAMTHLGFKAGTVEELEGNIVRNLFRLGNVKVRDIMTPRTVMFSLPASQTVDEVLDEHSELHFSRIPVWTDEPHNIVGYVRRDALLHLGRGGSDREIAALMAPILVVPETLAVSRLFDCFVDDREHLAIAIDEFGSVAGLVTMEDALETLLGLEIVDEVDLAPDMRALARQRWRKRAARLGVSVDEYDGAEE
jgi:CBS domain containing-hemolysin-like protein